MCSPARHPEASYQAVRCHVSSVIILTGLNKVILSQYGHSSVVAPNGDVLVEADEHPTIVYADIGTSKCRWRDPPKLIYFDGIQTLSCWPVLARVFPSLYSVDSMFIPMSQQQNDDPTSPACSTVAGITGGHQS